MGFHYFFNSKVLKVHFERFFKNTRGEAFLDASDLIFECAFVGIYKLYDVIIVLAN